MSSQDLLMAELNEYEEKPFVRLSNAIQGQTSWLTNLEGCLLTIVDAMISDKEQREAFKSLIRNAVRDHYSVTNASVMRVINHFTDKFEGQKIEYTVLKGTTPSTFMTGFDIKNDPLKWEQTFK